MVGTNLDTLRYSGESDPRSLTLETTTAFVLHSRARHLLVHSSLCLPANIFSLFLPFLSFQLCTRSPLFHFTQNFTIYLSIFLSLLFFFGCRFIYRYHLFSIISLARYLYGFFHRYRARIWFIARFVTINNNSRACSDGAHAAAHSI